EWLAETASEHLDRFAVGCDAKDRARVTRERVAALSALPDDEGTVRQDAQAGGELAGFRRLREGAGEQLVLIGLAVAVGVDDAPDAIPIVNEDFAAADAEAERFVEAGGEPAPSHVLEIAFEAGCEPDVAVERHQRRAAIREKADIREAYVAPPGIV